jgi:hypothetical protein
MMRAHQPGSQPIDIPEAIPNPAVPQPVPAPSPPPKEPVKAPAPQNAVGVSGNDNVKVRPVGPCSKMDRHHRARRRLKLRQLEILLAVADTGSMARAATRLAVSQPAISRAIADAEHPLGVPLFDRSTQGVEPTQTAARC